MKDAEEEDPHKRLKQLFSDLEREWDAMKTAKKSSASDSSITVVFDKALRFLGNSPRKLMLCLQRDRTCPETVKSPFIRRKLLFEDDDDDYKDNGFSVQESRVRSVLHDADDDEKMESLSRVSYSSCSSSNGEDSRNEIRRREKSRGRRNGLWFGVCFVVVLVLVVLMNGSDRSENKQMIALVPT